MKILLNVIKHTLAVFTLTVIAFTLMIITNFMPSMYESIIRTSLDMNTVLVREKLYTGKYKSLGTGFQINTKKSKYIITNRHVCGFRDSVLIHYKGKDTKSKVLKLGLGVDLCIVEPIPELEGLELGSRSYSGDKVYTIGYTGGIPVKQFYTGEISGFTDALTLPLDSPTDKLTSDQCLTVKGDLNIIKTPRGIIFICTGKPFLGISTLTAGPGSSGSPVMNAYFEIVGVVMIKSNHNTAGFVPINIINKFINQYEGE